MAETINRNDLKAKLDKGEKIILLEALGPQYYNDAHLPGALNFPLDKVKELAPTLIPSRDAEVVVYCSNTACKNSEIAANELISLGYTNVRKYAEGKQDWINAGLPFEGTRAQKA